MGFHLALCIFKLSLPFWGRDKLYSFSDKIECILAQFPIFYYISRETKNQAVFTKNYYVLYIENIIFYAFLQKCHFIEMEEENVKKQIDKIGMIMI